MMGGRRSFTPREPVERPEDPQVRRANLRRVAGLFRPYRLRLGIVLALIALSAVLGMISPFLLRAVLDTAIPKRDTTLLGWLVGGMIAISVVTGVLGVLQTYIVERRRPARDARPARGRLPAPAAALARVLHAHAHGRGPVADRERHRRRQSVVTSTATSIVSSVTTVLTVVVAMFLLDWRLAVFSLALLPLFVFLTRRVGKERQRITRSRQGTLADISTLVEESLSVSGILLGKTMGRSPELADRFEGESERLADLEVRSSMAGRWVMATIQTTFAVMPALVYWFGGIAIAHGSSISIGTLVAFTTLQTRLFFPVGSLLSVGVDVQTSLALFDRVFEYLDLPVEIAQRPDARPLPKCRGDVVFDHVWFRYEPDGRWTLKDVSIEVPAGTRTAIVGETGSGKTTLGYLVARLYDVERGAVLIDGIDVRDATFESLARTVGVVSQETYLFHASIRDNLRFARPDATDEEIEEAARAARIHDLIAGLPDGYDTVVGERGYRFSGRREAADRDRAHDPAQSPGAGARRGDERAGHADGARGPGGARPPCARPDDDRDRPSALDRPGRRPDRRARPRRDRRAGHARGAPRGGRQVRGAREPGCGSRRSQVTGLHS